MTTTTTGISDHLNRTAASMNLLSLFLESGGTSIDVFTLVFKKASNDINFILDNYMPENFTEEEQIQVVAMKEHLLYIAREIVFNENGMEGA